jgi:ribokinase
VAEEQRHFPPVFNIVWSVRPPKVAAIDLQRGGDVFCSAPAVALIRGQKLKSAVQWACFAAALSVTRIGTIAAFPALDEVSNFIENAVLLY